MNKGRANLILFIESQTFSILEKSTHRYKQGTCKSYSLHWILDCLHSGKKVLPCIRFQGKSKPHLLHRVKQAGLGCILWLFKIVRVGEGNELSWRKASVTNIVLVQLKRPWHWQNCDQTLLKHHFQTGNVTIFSWRCELCAVTPTLYLACRLESPAWVSACT